MYPLENLNIKAIWDIINQVISKDSWKDNYPQYFRENDVNLDQMNDVVGTFDRYFVNVGPNQAKK